MLRRHRGRSLGERLWLRTCWPMTHPAPLRTSPGSCPGSSPQRDWRLRRSILRVSGPWCPPTTTTSSWQRWEPALWAPTWSSGPGSTSASNRSQECFHYVTKSQCHYLEHFFVSLVPVWKVLTKHWPLMSRRRTSSGESPTRRSSGPSPAGASTPETARWVSSVIW